MLNNDNVTYIIISSDREIIYRMYENIPSFSKVIILYICNTNLPISKNNFLQLTKVFEIDKIDKLAGALNNILWNEIDTDGIIFLKNNSIESKHNLEKLKSNILKNSIYIENNNICIWNNKEKLKEGYFNDKISINNLFIAFVLYIVNKCSYILYGNFLNLTIDQKIFVNDYLKQLKNKIVSNMKYTILIPSTKNIKLINDVFNEKYDSDELIYFNCSPLTLSKKICDFVKNSTNDNIIILNPNIEILGNLLTKIKEVNYNKYFIINKDDINSTSIIFSKNTFDYSISELVNSFKDYISKISTHYEKKYSLISKNINIIPKEVKVHKKKIENRLYTFIIPFMYNGDRWPLFEACIDNLHTQIKERYDNFRIVIHETNKKRHITDEFIKKYNITYLYNKFDKVFHRGWSLNVGARYITYPENKENILIFMDGDIILTKNWFDSLETVSHLCVGWDILYDLTQDQTQEIISNKQYDVEKYKSSCNYREPNLNGACGGVGIIPKNIFFEIKGFPEFFEGTWGGEDNALMHKLKCFGYSFSKLNGEIYHLYHTHKTIRVQSIKNKWKDVVNWNKKAWVDENNKLGNNWGIGKQISIAMINYLREEKLLSTLKTILKNSHIPLSITLQEQGCEDISDIFKKELESILSNFCSFNVKYTKGNIGTAVPRYNTTMDTLEKQFDYTIIIDSDMQIPYSCFEYMFNEIEKRPTYGAISCWCEPNYNGWIISKNKLMLFKLNSNEFHDTDALGTGCVIVRTELFKNAQFNTDLVIGFIDFLWCMEIRNKTSWKMGILSNLKYKLINNRRGDGSKYSQARNNLNEINKSREYFKKKWQINV